MAFRLSDLNAVTASVSTDIFHLRTTGGLDKKITHTNLFNNIQSATVIGATLLNTLITKGQTVLARDGGVVLVGTSTPKSNILLVEGSLGTNTSTIDGTSIFDFYEGALTDADFSLMADFAGTGSGGNAIRFGSNMAGWELNILTMFGNGSVILGSDTDSGDLEQLQVNGESRIINDWNGSGDPQLVISGATSTAKRLRIGYDTTLDMGVISATQQGVGNKPIVLNPVSGNVLIHTLSNPGETLHIGSGGFRNTGTSGNIILPSSGNIIEFTRVSNANYLNCTSSGGYLVINTDGNTGLTNANVIFNANKSSSFIGFLEHKNGIKPNEKITSDAGAVHSDDLYNFLADYLSTTNGDWRHSRGLIVDLNPASSSRDPLNILYVERFSSTEISIFGYRFNFTTGSFSNMDELWEIRVDVTDSTTLYQCTVIM